MTSPLGAYANAYLLITSEGVPTVIEGRVTASSGDTYLVECYLKRQESQGVNTGASYGKVNMMPGASGDAYLYRGYALRYAKVTTDYDLQALNTNVSWIELRSMTKPSWLVDGSVCKHQQGLEQTKHCTIERCSGKYGGNQIDELISNEIGGIPIIVRSGDVIN